MLKRAASHTLPLTTGNRMRVAASAIGAIIAHHWPFLQFSKPNACTLVDMSTSESAELVCC